MAKPIVVKITGDATGFKKALDGASGMLSSFTSAVGTALKTGGLAAAGAAAGGVAAFTQFDEQMREVLTLLPDAGDDTFSELGDQVKDFSKEFGKLPSEVIPSLYQALSAGVPQDNVFEFLEVAQQAAKGGVTELETAVDGISSVVNAYGSDVISATEASDLMFTAVRLGKTDFEQLSSSLFNVAPIAAALEVPFSSVTTAIANLTAQGTPTSVAATQMKAALSELGKEGTKADKAFQDLAGMGFTQFLETEGNMASAFMLLAEGAEETGGSVLDMFGSIEAGQAVLGLTADGGQAMLETLGEMGDSAGATSAAFETMDGSLSSSFDKLKSRLTVSAIEFGERLAPAVATATDFILEHWDTAAGVAEDIRKKVQSFAGTVVNYFQLNIPRAIDGAKVKFDELVEAGENVRDEYMEHKDLFDGIAIAIGSMATGLAAVYAVQQGMTALTTAIAAVRAATAAMSASWIVALGPIGWIAAAIAAVVAGLVIAYRRFETVRNIVNAVAGVFVSVGETIYNFAKEAIGTVITAVGNLASWFSEKFEMIRSAVAVAFDAVLGVILPIAGWFDKHVISTIEAMVEYFVVLTQRLIDVFKFAFDVLSTVFSALMDVLAPVFKFIADEFKRMWDIVTSLLNVALDVIKVLLEPIILAFKIAFEAIKTVVVVVFDAIVAVIESVLAVIRGIFTAGKALLEGDFGALWDGLVGIVKDIFDSIKGVIATAINEVRKFFGRAKDGIVSAFSGIWNGVKEAAKSAFNFIADAWNNTIGRLSFKVPGWVPGLGGKGWDVPDIPKFATGGIMGRDGLAMVGERGPELVSLPKGAKVTPAHATPSMQGATINVTANTNADPYMIAREVSWALITQGG